MKFTSSSYTVSEIGFTSLSAMNKIDYAESSTWDFVQSTTEVTTEDSSPTIIFTLDLHRKPLFYVLNIIVPIMLLSVMNIFTFLLPVKSGERASYAVTIFLSISVFLTIIASEFPKNSDSLSYLGLYLILMTSVSTIFVIISVVQLRLIHRDDEENVNVGTFYKLLCRIVNCLRCKGCARRRRRKMVDVQKNGNDNNIVRQKEAEEVTWSDVVNAMDFLCFLIGIIVILSVTLAIMMILLNNPRRTCIEVGCI